MRIIFMGTTDFAVPSLSAIAQSGHTILSVVTAPDLPRGRGQKVSYTPVKKEALKLGLPVLQTENLKEPAFVSAIQNLNPDLIIVVAFRILPKEIFTVPKSGSVNLHASLLPKYRGAAPINRAIIRGDKETGVTTFFLKEKVDTGNIILQRKTEIGDNETAGELHDRLAISGAEALLETINQIATGTVTTQIQDETTATSAPKISREDCRIDWEKPSRDIHNFIRGLSPYPCAHTILNGESIKIYKTERHEATVNKAESGTIVTIDHHKGIGVATGDKKIIYIKELQPASKKRMTVSEYLRGHKIEVLSRFN